MVSFLGCEFCDHGVYDGKKVCVDTMECCVFSQFLQENKGYRSTGNRNMESIFGRRNKLFSSPDMTEATKVMSRFIQPCIPNQSLHHLKHCNSHNQAPLRLDNHCFQKYNAPPVQETTLQWFPLFVCPALVLKINYKH